ncbi:hypothetical protein K2173_024003 [Erythroxylum novogranatense]|uniref:Uncharacterized protein n=1 Tax=Erythroxylum novogranatense TaxID=1862640 RepID=A0AAV8TTC2_9ROSI|nr:hypothetical protein K2173_024003 [Erythroxylum novogranatense]
MEFDFPCDSPQLWPYMQSSYENINSHNQIHPEATENFLENLLQFDQENEEDVIEVTATMESDGFPLEVSGNGGSWWNLPSGSVNDRLMLAIRYLKEYVESTDVLIQIWVPIETRGKIVLTTTDQPYSLNPNYTSLASYRDVSENFNFPVEEDSKDSAGLPGRVFLGKFPEWTPDVRFFRNEECPRKEYAKLYSISGCLAIPILEPESGICLAVMEIITTTQKISYHLERESVYKALEAVDLNTSLYFCRLRVESGDYFGQVQVPDIPQILQRVCKIHGLPLALTWSPCVCQGKSGKQQLVNKYGYCISTVNSACFIADTDYSGFYVACSEQHLFLNQGIVGNAFTTNHLCFNSDISAFSRTNYPLSHHARMFNLHAAVAIPLRNIHSRVACQSFHVILERELNEEINSQMDVVSEGRNDEDGNRKPCPLTEPFLEQSCWITYMMEAEKKVEGICVSLGSSELEPKEEFKVTIHWDENKVDLYGCRKVGEKKHSKPEKTISLQVLQKYFAGSLKNAADSLGVGPTTLKRICRQHGITRWPSRKIKKVGHSLKKLQILLDSVHGGNGVIPLDSFYTTFPELNSPNLFGNDHFTRLEPTENLNELDSKPEGGSVISKDADSGSHCSSCSQNSTPLICCSSDAKQLNSTINDLNTGNDPMMEEVAVEVKTCTQTELNPLNQEEPKFPAVSQSHKPVDDHLSIQTPSTQSKGFVKILTDGVALRIKATFRDENIRLSLQPNWGFKDLQREIAQRFSIDNLNGIHLRYLDDDQEPVLLTCDADLEECRDLFRSSQGHIIKIYIHQTPEPNSGN